MDLSILSVHSILSDQFLIRFTVQIPLSLSLSGSGIRLRIREKEQTSNGLTFSQPIRQAIPHRLILWKTLLLSLVHNLLDKLQSTMTMISYSFQKMFTKTKQVLYNEYTFHPYMIVSNYRTWENCFSLFSWKASYAQCFNTNHIYAAIKPTKTNDSGC